MKDRPIHHLSVKVVVHKIMDDSLKDTVVKAYLEHPGLENIGGEYQDTILKPNFGWVFYLLPI